MMLKKALISAAIIAVSTSGLAFDNGGNLVPAVKSLDGLYVGVGIISDTTRYKNVVSTNTDVGMDGSAGELFIGYAWNWYRYLYTGLEVFGQLSSNKGLFFGFNRKQESDFGVRIMPGFRIANSTVLFGNFGYVRTRSISDDPITGRVFNLDGMQFGAGLQTKIDCNLALRGGWNINRFTNISSRSGGLYNNQFYIDAIYQFMA